MSNTRERTLVLDMDDVNYLYNLLYNHCANLGDDEESRYDYEIANEIAEEIKKQAPHVRVW